MELLGIHHLTAVSAQIRANHHFYTRSMSMRLVKRSVNQDDTSAYHLFYADAKGSEDEATLGEKIVLAPFLEPQRAQIVANLKPID
jgi:catechol 2,3-dioxygenase-like lactoylglutathione lyase family enzyme